MATLRDRAQSPEPGKLIELFMAEIPNGPTQYFHRYTERTTTGVLVFHGLTFLPWALEATGWEYSTDGPMPRPHLTLSDFDSAITALMLLYDRLMGTKVTRIRTFEDFLDGKPNAGQFPDEYPRDVYVVDSIPNATPGVAIEFELISPIDNENVVLPGRQIKANCCDWDYRGPDCGYVGPPVTDALGVNFGMVYTDGVLNKTKKLTSATANFVPGDVGHTVAGAGIPVGTTVFARVSATEITMSNVATITASRSLFTISRLRGGLAYNSGTTYALNDFAYTLSVGIKIYWVSLSNNNTAPLTDPTKWKMDVCPKQLRDCKGHHGANNILPYGGFPGAGKVPRG